MERFPSLRGPFHLMYIQELRDCLPGTRSVTYTKQITLVNLGVVTYGLYQNIVSQQNTLAKYVYM